MTYFVDYQDFKVYVGDVVMFREEFDIPGMSDKSYVVVGLPNYADMVEMTEITDLDYDETTCRSTFRIVNENDVISVEPWKLGAI